MGQFDRSQLGQQFARPVTTADAQWSTAETRDPEAYGDLRFQRIWVDGGRYLFPGQHQPTSSCTARSPRPVCLPERGQWILPTNCSSSSSSTASQGDPNLTVDQWPRHATQSGSIPSVDRKQANQLVQTTIQQSLDCSVFCLFLFFSRSHQFDMTSIS